MRIWIGTKMIATIVHFATCIPDWNSLDSVRRAHSWLEAAALGFFALLVVFDVLAHMSERKDESRAHLLEKVGLCFFAVAVLSEIAAYPYGQRNDTLSARVIVSLDATARDAASKASQALADSSRAEIAVDKVGKKADSYAGEIAAAKKASDMNAAALADRKLTDIQIKSIVGKLEKYRGQKFRSVPYWNSPESVALHKQIGDALVLAKWVYVPEKAATFNPSGLVGIMVYVNSDADKGTKGAAESLIEMLRKDGLQCGTFPSAPSTGSGVEQNTINLMYGAKR